METYIYSVIGHTANAMASLDILHSEIALGLGANFEHLTTRDDVLEACFSSAVSPEENTTLTGIIGAHNGT